MRELLNFFPLGGGPGEIDQGKVSAVRERVFTDPLQTCRQIGFPEPVTVFEGVETDLRYALRNWSLIHKFSAEAVVVADLRHTVKEREGRRRI